MDSYLDSSHQAKGPPNMAPNRVAGGMVHSASSSGIFFSADAQSQVLGNSLLSSSFGNSSHVIPGLRGNLGPLSGDVSNMVLNSVASSGPSVGGSSLVTDANSGLSGGPHFQRSASFNTDSYMRLPASPLSFSSNNISISGSSIVDGSSVAHPNSNQDPNSQQSRQGQLQPGTSSAASLPASRGEQIQHPNDTGSFLQDQVYFSQLQKKPRLDIKQENVLPQQVLQQMLQRQDSLHLQNPNTQLQALIQQQRLRQQQQQILQSMSPTQRAQLIQQQQLQLRQQGVQPSPTMKRPYDGGVCSRRLMQYLYHQRQRPPDNIIGYWRKFVAEYYSPRAKKRWCLSLYDNVGNHSLGVFPQAAMDAWQCDICGSKSGRGFEATFEVLPRLNEIKFGSGVIDELLFLDLPRECRFPSGIMMLEYAKAVQESVYEQLRVVREGQLRIIFAADLKILSWEFCAQRHEELLPRRVVEPQVKQALQVAQKCQNAISEIGPDGVSQQDLQATSNMIVTAGRQLSRNLDSQALNDLGFSKRYVRCLQIAEVVNSTKDIMDYCKEQKVGPIEALKTFAKLHQSQKMQEMDQQLGGTQSLSSDKSPMSKLTASHSGLNSPIANSPQMPGIETVNGSGAQSDIALSNYLNLLMRQNSTNSNRNSVQQQQQQEAPSSTNSSNHNPSIGNVQGPGLSGFHMEPQRYLQGNALQTQMNMQHSQGNDGLQQRMIQQLMQEMRNHGGNGIQQPQQQQQYIAGQNTGGVVSRNGFGFGNSTLSGGIGAGNGSNGPVNNNNNNVGAMPGRSNSFKATSNSETSAGGGVGNNSEFNNKAAQNMNLLEGLPDVARDFTENGFLSGDLDDDNMSFDWKV